MMTESETGRGVFTPLASLPGPGDARGKVARLFFAEGRSACHSAVRVEPPPIGAASGADGREACDRDQRIATHEASHCLSGLVLFGPGSIGGSTIVATEKFGGLTWGPTNSAEFGSMDDVPVDLCEAMRAMLPHDGEPIVGGSEIHAQVRGRCVDLLSGAEGERLLCTDGPPWLAESDVIQAKRLASIVCSSAETAELFLAFCRAEAASLVAKHSASIRAVAAALIEHRTLSGDQIVAVVAESVAAKAMADERARRDDWRFRQESARHFSAVAQPIAKAQCGV
jgi:hypothetical protein